MSKPMPIEKNSISAVLLAGGKSRRMGGGDKCLLELAGSPMLSWVIERIENQVDTIAINANGDPGRFALFNHPVIPDTLEDNPGPLAGVLAGMRWAKAQSNTTSYILSLPTDAPFLPQNLVSKLSAPLSEDNPKIVLAASLGRTHPVFGLWPVALADDLQGALESGTRKIMDWVESHPTEIIEFPEITIGDQTIDPFFNTNTPENMQEARLILENMLTLKT